MRKIEDLLEDEWYHVRYSGEIPEVALHSSIHFLTEDSEGPEIHLDEKSLRYLQGAAVSRYREIILRDITPENRETTIYRGVLRTIANWRRLKRFCHRHELSYGGLKDEIGRQLLVFLNNEIEERQENKDSTSLNCSFVDLVSFAAELDVSLASFQDKLKTICQNIS
jgi:hypothetical protein